MNDYENNKEQERINFMRKNMPLNDRSMAYLNDKKQELINLMKDMPLETLSIAYLYAKNYVEYGDDVTKTWNTDTQNSCALEKAYRKGYYDAMQRQVESEGSNADSN